MTTSTHLFFQDSRIRPTPAPFAAPIAKAIAATLDEALQAALFDLNDDEDALRRSLEGDDRLEDAMPPPASSAVDNAHSDDLEDTQPLHLVTGGVEHGAAEHGAFVAPSALLISDIFSTATTSGRQVLDQDLRAQHDQDEPAHELEFFARFSA